MLILLDEQSQSGNVGKGWRVGNEGDQESQVLPIGVDSLITGPPILLAEVKLASSKILPSRYSCPSCESCEIFVKNKFLFIHKAFKWGEALQIKFGL